MSKPSDQDLRDHFAALRRDNEAGAPSFHATQAAARSRRLSHRPEWLMPAVAAVALLVAAAVAFLRPRAPRHPLVSLAVTRWQSPTDFLLQVPGAEYLTSVPKLTYRIAIPEWRNP